eukprot:12237066-Karenia_brevis.AAC.1
MVYVDDDGEGDDDDDDDEEDDDVDGHDAEDDDDYDGDDDDDGFCLVFRRSALNDRDEYETRLKYIQNIKDMGLVIGARNDFVCIAPTADSPFRDVLGGAHVVEAIYDAYEQDPDNAQVQATIEGGLDFIELETRSPSDVQKIWNLLRSLWDAGAPWVVEGSFVPLGIDDAADDGDES